MSSSALSSQQGASQVKDDSTFRKRLLLAQQRGAAVASQPAAPSISIQSTESSNVNTHASQQQEPQQTAPVDRKRYVSPYSQNANRSAQSRPLSASNTRVASRQEQQAQGRSSMQRRRASQSHAAPQQQISEKPRVVDELMDLDDDSFIDKFEQLLSERQSAVSEEPHNGQQDESSSESSSNVADIRVPSLSLESVSTAARSASAAGSNGAAEAASTVNGNPVPTPRERLIELSETIHQASFSELVALKVEKVALSRLQYGPQHREQVKALLDLCQSYLATSQYQIALEHAENALTMNNALLALEKSNVQARLECEQLTVLILATMALICYKQADYERCEIIVNKTLALHEELLRRRLLELAQQHGSVSPRSGSSRRATQGSDVDPDTLRRNHALVGYPIYMTLGKCCIKLHRYEDAEAALTAARKCRELIEPKQSQDLMMAAIHIELGNLYLSMKQTTGEEQGDVDGGMVMLGDAISCYERAKAVVELRKGKLHLDVGHLCFVLAELYFEKRDYENAASSAKQALSCIEERQRTDPDTTENSIVPSSKLFIAWKVQVMFSYACSLIKLEQFEETLPLLDTACAIAADSVPTGLISDKERASLFTVLGNVLMTLQKLNESLHVYHQACRLYLKVHGGDMEAGQVQLIISRMAQCHLIQQRQQQQSRANTRSWNLSLEYDDSTIEDSQDNTGEDDIDDARE